MTQIKDSRIRWSHTMDNLSVRRIDSEAVGAIYLAPPFNLEEQLKNLFIKDNHCAFASFKDTRKLFDIYTGEEEMLSAKNYTQVKNITFNIGE